MEKTGTDLVIKKWDIINLVEDRDLCQFKLRSGKNCGKIARFAMKVTAELSCVLCNAHKDKCKVEVTETGQFKCMHTKCQNNSKINILDNPDWWCDCDCCVLYDFGACVLSIYKYKIEFYIYNKTKK